MTNLLWDNFHFVRPLWLAGIIPALILFFLLRFAQLRSNGWNKAIDPSLLPHLLDREQEHRRNWPLFLLLFGWLLTCVSLAGPAWEKLPQPVQKKEDALVLIQDLSLSLYATDLPPNRLVRAQHKLEDILKMRKEGTTGLIVYAGDAHVVAPLTDDGATIAAMIPSLSPAIMPVYGSNAAQAIPLALRLLKDAGVAQGRILLLTDEVSEDAARKIADELHNTNIELLVLGVGTADGGPIPKANGGFLKDDGGNIIVPRLNRNVLRGLAEDNRGRYSDIQLDDGDIDYLLAAEPLIAQPGNYRQLDREFDQWKETGPWLLLLIVPAALLAFRKGWLLVLVLTFSLWGGDCHALTWQDLWLTKDQQAANALQSDDPGKAAELFRSQAWKGVAQYKAGEFDEAVETFDRQETADSYYNRGNALTRAGKYQEALQAYDEALQRNPKMEDAAFNRNLVEQLLQQQQQQQQNQETQQNKDDQQQNKDDQQQDKQDNGKNQQQAQQDQGKDRQEQEQNQGADNKQQQAQNGQESQGQEKDAQQENEQSQSSEKKSQDGSTGEQQKETPQNRDQSGKEQEKKAARKSEKEGPEKLQPDTAAQGLEDNLTDEEKQELEQWLRQVPDDPGGLLRRKFEYESRRNREGRTSGENKKIW